MADTLYPVNAVTGAPAYSGRMLRQTGSPSFGGATAARPLGARSGVRPGTSVTTVTATGTTWSCAAFAGVADVQAAAEAGPYQFAFDAVATGAVTAANASSPRSDIIYVQVDDPSESDGSTVPLVTRKYLAGIAGAGAPVPALPVSRAFIVAVINVPASGGGSPSVTWVAPHAVAAGGLLPLPDSSFPASPHVGQQVYRQDLKLPLVWDGAIWAGAWHTEFTGSASAPAGTNWGPGALTVDSSQSHAGSPIVTTANDTVTLPGAGVYAISCRVNISAAASGLTYVSLQNGSGFEFTSIDVTAGNSSITLTMPNLRMTAAGVVKFVFRGGTAATWVSRIRVTKVG